MLITIDVSDTSLPLETPYAGQWAGEEQAKQSGTVNVWLPLRDINGLSDAITALARIEGKQRSGLSSAEAQQRAALLDLARRIITAERELQLREFAKLLGHALSPT